MKKQFFLLFSCVFLTAYSQQKRYTDPIFNDVAIIPNIVYDNAPFLKTASNINESSTKNRDLVMDMYYPKGDKNHNRPVIVFAHAGGFIVGNRKHQDMVSFCKYFAARGYVTVSIDYRQGFYMLDDVAMHGTRAVYRGIQDGRSAVRFLRANAKTYGLDASKVYFLGSSAGAFIGLHSIFLEDKDKPKAAGAVAYKSLFTNFTGPDLGAFDIGNNLSFNGTPDALISLWGAIQDLDLINNTDTTPIFIVHGEKDPIVPFSVGKPFYHPLLPNVYGSDLINKKLDSLHFTNKEAYFITNKGHEFYGTLNGNWLFGANKYQDIIFEKSAQFLWKQHRPNIGFSTTINGATIAFKNTSKTATKWHWDFGDGQTSTEQHPVHTYSDSGVYNVKLYIEDSQESWNETFQKLTIEASHK